MPTAFRRYIPNTTPNMNQLALVEIPMTAVVDESRNTGFTTVGNAIRCDFNGVVSVQAVVYAGSAGQRVGPYILLYKNNNVMSLDANMYIRNNGGLVDGSGCVQATFKVEKNDLVVLKSQRRGSVSDVVSLIIIGSHFTVRRFA